MRTRFAVVGTALAGMLVSGCSGGLLTGGSGGGDGDASEDEVVLTQPAMPSASSESDRPDTAPVKSLELNDDECAIVQDYQASQLGANHPEKEHFDETAGITGCFYSQGTVNNGYGVFVAVRGPETMRDFVRAWGSRAEETTVENYPAAEVSSGRSCYLSVDVSDDGQLYLTSTVYDPTADACSLANRYAEKALINLDDA